MKQPPFCGRELLPLSVIEAVRVGDPLAVESVLRYYDGFLCLCWVVTKRAQAEIRLRPLLL